jgi:hypothetical protein
MSVANAILVLSRKERATMPRKPRMTASEKRFETLITNFVFVENGGRLVDSPKWQMLNEQTKYAYLTLIATKTR